MQRGSDIIPVSHSLLDGEGRRHWISAVVEQLARETIQAAAGKAVAVIMIPDWFLAFMSPALDVGFSDLSLSMK
jgi:hypothetical protein